MLRSGSIASNRAERPSPQGPACVTSHAPDASSAPCVSSHTAGGGATAACACTREMTASRATRACHFGTNAMAKSRTLAAPPKPVEGVTDWVPLLTSETMRTCKALGKGSDFASCHSVAYRCRTTGASTRSTRDLKPSSCACPAPSMRPSQMLTASAPAITAVCQVANGAKHA
eukprot:4306801-Prymnesium_polylepis.2